jgi:predicted metal-dependent phosphoesterase TrpH
MIDLHTDTDQSDGSVAPARLVRHSMAPGLEALAITDHDTLAGYDAAAPVATEAGLELICGIELNTRLEESLSGKRAPSVHLLGYFIPQPPSAEFRQWLLRLQVSRNRRNIDLIAKLQALDIAISLEEVQALGRNLTGRPQFAQIPLRKGYVAPLQKAFDLYLADEAKAAVEREEPALVEGVRGICEGGSLLSFAHPVRLARRDRLSLEALLHELKATGLQGIEVCHSEHGDKRPAFVPGACPAVRTDRDRGIRFPRRS